MYEFADTVGNILSECIEFFEQPMNIPKVLSVLSLCALTVVILFQFRLTRILIAIAILFAIDSVIFSFVYGFLYALSGDGIIHLIFGIALIGGLSGFSMPVIRIFLIR